MIGVIFIFLIFFFLFFAANKTKMIPSSCHRHPLLLLCRCEKMRMNNYAIHCLYVMGKMTTNSCDTRHHCFVVLLGKKTRQQCRCHHLFFLFFMRRRRQWHHHPPLLLLYRHTKMTMSKKTSSFYVALQA